MAGEGTEHEGDGEGPGAGGLGLGVQTEVALELRNGQGADGDRFKDVLRPSGKYSLSDVQLDILNPMTALFRARLNGPPGAPIWVRAWLSTETGTVAEAASPQLTAGEYATLEVTLRSPESPQTAYMRIESAPLNTEHVVALKLT